MSHESLIGDPRVQRAKRSKGDPYLTRVIYGVLAWASGFPIEKGFTQLDWLRLTRSGADMNEQQGAAPRKEITLEEVKLHRSRDDAWMVLHGKVYNATHYLKYHPGGGDILLSVAGKDATSEFMKYHPWVATDSLLHKCLVGWLAPAKLQETAYLLPPATLQITASLPPPAKQETASQGADGCDSKVCLTCRSYSAPAKQETASQGSGGCDGEVCLTRSSCSE
eukprot:gene18900-25458_t